MRPLQREIIQQLKVLPTVDAEKEIRRSIDFIKDYFLAHPFLKRAVLGISGGQDSTLTGRLGQLAMKELREETGDADYQFLAVCLPYGRQKDQDDVELALDFIQADRVIRVDIKAAVDALVQSIDGAISDFNKGNIKARMRMVTQYAIAGQEQGVVLGTDHAAESVTGFYTKFGDGACDILPIWRLNKRQGRELLKALGANPRLYEKIPTADLEENAPLKPDEEALGVTYQAIDDYLEGREVSVEEAERIESWYLKTAHKRHLPITVYDDFWRK